MKAYTPYRIDSFCKICLIILFFVGVLSGCDVIDSISQKIHQKDRLNCNSIEVQNQVAKEFQADILAASRLYMQLLPTSPEVIKQVIQNIDFSVENAQTEEKALNDKKILCKGEVYVTLPKDIILEANRLRSTNYSNIETQASNVGITMLDNSFQHKLNYNVQRLVEGEQILVDLLANTSQRQQLNDFLAVILVQAINRGYHSPYKVVQRSQSEVDALNLKYTQPNRQNPISHESETLVSVDPITESAQATKTVLAEVSTDMTNDQPKTTKDDIYVMAKGEVNNAKPAKTTKQSTEKNATIKPLDLTFDDTKYGYTVSEGYTPSTDDTNDVDNELIKADFNDIEEEEPVESPKNINEKTEKVETVDEEETFTDVTNALIDKALICASTCGVP